MIPNRNAGLCGIAGYGYCILWRFFTPGSGLVEAMPSFSDPSKWQEYFYLPTSRASRVATADLTNRLLSVRPVTYDTEKEAWAKALASVGITDSRMVTHHFRGQMQREADDAGVEHAQIGRALHYASAKDAQTTSYLNEPPLKMTMHEAGYDFETQAERKAAYAAHIDPEARKQARVTISARLPAN